MFLELFWPKELKQAIAECREKGVLNEEALYCLRKNTITYFVIYVIIALLLLTTLNIAAGIVLLLLSPAFIWFDLRKLFYNQIAAYCYGTLKKVTICKVGIGFYGSQRLVAYDAENNCHEVINLGRSRISPKENLPSVGEVVEVYVDRHHRYGATLNLQHLKKYFSLKQF